MIKVSILYNNDEGTTFDHEYYQTTHMALAREHLEPRGLIKVGVEKCLAGGAPGEKPAFHCIGSLYFESAEAFHQAMAEVGGLVRADIPNFTNATPTRVLSEVVL